MAQWRFFASFVIAVCIGHGCATTSTPSAAENRPSQLVTSQTATTPGSTAESSSATSGATATPDGNPTPDARPTPGATIRPEEIAHARSVLAQWDQIAGAAGERPLVLTRSMPVGGGWDQENDEAAFAAGLIELTSALTSVYPGAVNVRWGDGRRMDFETLSPTAAIDSITDPTNHGKPCTRCKPLGLEAVWLRDLELETSTGLATVPMWRFRFVPGDRPDAQLLFPAVRNAAFLPVGAEDLAYDFRTVIGTETSTEVTMLFAGNGVPADQQCGADYSAFVLESQHSIVVVPYVTREGPLPPSGQCVGGLSFDTVRITVRLADEVGTRTFLHSDSGSPLPRYDVLPV